MTSRVFPTPFIFLPLIIMILLMLYTYRNFKTQEASKYMRIITTVIASLVSVFGWWFLQLEGLACLGRSDSSCLDQINSIVSPLRYFYLGLPIILFVRPKRLVIFLALIAVYLVSILTISFMINV